MALALNRFKTFTKELTTVSQTIYTAPTGYTGIILYAHITNSVSYKHLTLPTKA